MLKCVILDMDGTLLDTERLSVIAWQRAARAYGYEIPADFIMGYFGMNCENIDQLYLEKFGPDFPIRQIRAARMEEGTRYMRENPIPVKPGALELLEHIRSRGLIAALATGTDLDQAEFELRKAGLWDLLQIKVSGHMVPHGKPAPDIFQEVLRRSRCAPEESLVVEDTENGARGALAAGCHTIIVPDLRQPGKAIRPLLYRCCPSLFEVMDAIDDLIAC